MQVSKIQIKKEFSLWGKGSRDSKTLEEKMGKKVGTNRQHGQGGLTGNIFSHSKLCVQDVQHFSACLDLGPAKVQRPKTTEKPD